MNFDWIKNWLKDPFPGFKTYVAAIGLVAHGVYQITQGNVDIGVTEVLAGLAAFGLRNAVDRPTEPAK